TVDRDILLGAAGTPHARALRAERREGADLVGGPRAGARLEVAAREDERDDHGGGVVVEEPSWVEARRGERRAEEGRDDRDCVGGRRPDDDGGVHAGAPAAPRRAT